MAIRLHVDPGIRRGGVDGHELATQPDRFSRNRAIDRAGRGLLDFLSLQGFFSAAAVDVRGRAGLCCGRPIHRDYAARPCGDGTRIL